MKIPYIYVFVRADIPVIGQLVQVGHACYQAGAQFGQEEVPHLILIGVPDEESLLGEARRVQRRGIRIEVFHETGVVYAGRTDPVSGYTAACTEPLRGDVRRWFKRYELYSL